MGFMKAVLDSDVLIDFLLGDPRAKAELDQYDALLFSIVSWMEIMCGADTQEERDAAARLFQSMQRVDLTTDIAAKAVEIRRSMRLKFPDAVILATADVEGCILVTRNSKDFSASDPRVRVPYSS